MGQTQNMRILLDFGIGQSSDAHVFTSAVALVPPLSTSRRLRVVASHVKGLFDVSRP